MRSIFDCEWAELAHSVSPSYRATQIFKSIYQRWLTSFDEMTDLDLRYLADISLRNDLAIILKTVRTVLKGEGSY